MSPARPHQTHDARGFDDLHWVPVDDLSTQLSIILDHLEAQDRDIPSIS